MDKISPVIFWIYIFLMWHYRSRVVISIACCLISHSMTFETSSIRFHCSKTVFCDIIADALRFLMSSCALTWEQQCFSDNVQFISDKCVCVCDRLNQNDGGMKERKRKESLPAVRLHDSSGWWSTAQVCVCVCVCVKREVKSSTKSHKLLCRGR